MLLEKSSQRRAILEDSYRLQQFERDCDETKGWINEKLKFATDDSYLVSIKPIQFTVVNINNNYYGLYSSTILGVFSYLLQRAKFNNTVSQFVFPDSGNLRKSKQIKIWSTCVLTNNFYRRQKRGVYMLDYIYTGCPTYNWP